MRAPAFLLISCAWLACLTAGASATLVAEKRPPRVIVSTDIGGTDPDDFQSMVHLLLYADVLDVEGLVSSPFGPGRREHILEVIDRYAADYPALQAHSSRYPRPDALRRLTFQGAVDPAPYEGVSRPTAGSDAIVRAARRADARPLHVLVWGGLEDLAQALHDAPDIRPVLRVYWIGGPNKKWSPDAYQYLVDHHPDLWIIEANATYRGWFVGGDQAGAWGNQAFVATHVSGRGALGRFFASQLGGSMKMGDTPSVARLLQGEPDDPSRPGWGGRYVRAWDRPFARFDRLPTTADRMEQFGILELVLRLGADVPATPAAGLVVENQSLAGHVASDGTVRFRFSPKDAKAYTFTIRSNVPALDGLAGGITAVAPSPVAARRPASRHPNWWTDDPSAELAEDGHLGARTVSRWRGAFLQDFASRLRRTEPPVTGPAAGGKPRIVVLTDIENEPDDAQSMVRFLTYANQWDVEGLVATTSVHQPDKVAAGRIRQIVQAYGQVRDNLEQHEAGFPTADALLAVIREGRPAFGMTAVGQGMDSPGSERIIEVVDRDDPRPVWVLVWGGPNCLAQALWKVRATRPEAALRRFVAGLRVHAISDQDDSGPWIRREFPGVFYVTSPGLHAGGAYHHATWSGISGDYFHGRFSGADYSLVTNEWLDRNVRHKGPLGAQYPRWEFLMEGDTPSFLNLISNGLSVPERPDWGGWGGRYTLYTPPLQKWHQEPETRPIWSDADDEVLGVDGRWHTGNHATIWRWREAFQHDFAARMDWTILPPGKANHPPLARLAHADALTARPGERVHLSAEGSSDPDGDALSYRWFYYPEAGTLTVSSGRDGQPVPIQGFDQPEASFVVPAQRVMPPGTGTMHIILAVTDHGTPRLTRYRRVIVSVDAGRPAAAEPGGRAP
jgi:hypothetical protein